MSTHLYVAPAAAGKTSYSLALVRQAARGLACTPYVVVPTQLQVRSWRHRLAQAGGAFGVRVLTFDRLVAACLSAAGEAYPELSEPVEYRLIRSVVDSLTLNHYAPLAARPGFIQVLQGLIRELKAALVRPAAFARAVEAMAGEPRLCELAHIYASYQERLQAHGWADGPGLTWLAVEALDRRAPHAARDWPLLVVDGFDSVTAAQQELVRVLAGRVGELIITVTGAVGEQRPLVHRRFDRTREDLERALGVRAEPLPVIQAGCEPSLAGLGAGLFRSGAAPINSAGAVDLVEAPDRAAEVRAALRWLKAQVVDRGMRPADGALLARHIAPYRPFIIQIAAEFGLPVRLLGGLPLRANPAVAAVLDVLRLVLPRSPSDPEPALPRRSVVEAWRSPYLDWSSLPAEGAAEPIGIALADADALDAAARWGRVIGGLSQWTEVLDHLAARAQPAGCNPPAVGAPDDEQGVPAGVPRGTHAAELRAKFGRFVQRLKPPVGEHSYREWVRWLEALIGPDPDSKAARFPAAEEPTSLQVVVRARAGVEDLAERDVAALHTLKDVLRGLVWAEEALGAGPGVRYVRFFEELAGAVEAASYRLPLHAGRDELVVADVVQARGVPFRAVALLGMAEAEFPATLGEDPFLRDADRRRLSDGFGLPLKPSTESAEIEFFYETVTRPWERLLLTRPRLADNGTPWQASPFWEEVRRLVQVAPQTLTGESLAPPAQVASWPELMESLAAHPGNAAARRWARQVQPERLEALDAAAGVLGQRQGRSGGAFDGDLTAQASVLDRRYGPAHVWSPSRLEGYRACPYSFFVGSALGLEPREEPTEGLNVQQLGTIFHLILERVYGSPRVADPTDVAQLLAALPDEAAAVLDEAPKQEGFRETAWWAQTRGEIVDKAGRTLEALGALGNDLVPLRHEASFGLLGQPELVVRRGQEAFRLRGIIDRVDRSAAGDIRVIDYKTAGPTNFSRKAVAEGKKLQIPLYALAARDALGLGRPVEGFYWHVHQAEASPFRLSQVMGGAEAAVEAAAEYAWQAVQGVRSGHFAPHPPEGGCPSYCPAAAFCWHYRPGFGG